MSVIINTNSAATVAANNLAGSNALLQRSLNRLSSGSKIVNPADDAGGLAVAMKLSAAAKRQAAVSNNIGNAVSLMQTQDGVLKVTGAILNRISELKVLNGDITKSGSDKANYQTEFSALQAQITAIASEKFNGISLFGTTDLTIGTTENGSTASAVTAKAVNLLGASLGMVASQWSASDIDVDMAYVINAGGAYVNSGETTIGFHNMTAANYSSVDNVTPGFSLTFDTNTNGSPSYTNMTIDAGGTPVDLTALLGAGSADHHVVIDDNGTNTSFTVDGTLKATVASIATSGGAPLTFSAAGRTMGDFHIAHVSLVGGAATSGTGNVAGVASASDLGAVDLSTVTAAIQDVATYRAQNGATQSRLGYANELLSTNKANLEAATSRIMDVDVAAESTQLARFNILVQAGTSMLSQANQSAQMALKLLS